MSEKFTKLSLDVVGFAEKDLVRFRRYIKEPYGMVLVTGPTGSGKTSTLYASLQTLDAKVRNIVTVEDPIEYEYDKNIAQVQVSEKMTFPRVMRTFLRQDPDVMLVGEMRDPESLGIGIQAGLTGHLVLSTLHTNNAIETIGRMVDMDAEPYLVSGVVVAILAQRLVRLNCNKCREAYRPTVDEMEVLKFAPDELEKARFAKGKGCPECRGTGYRGRIGVFELILGTPEFRAAIAKNLDFASLQEIARKQGYRTMVEDGKAKTLSGWTTPEEVIKAVYTQTVE